jgi:hypothetical protein
MHPASVALFEAIKHGEYEGYTSTYVIDELSAAPEPKRSYMLGLILKYDIRKISNSDAAIKLAEAYIKNNIIPEKKKLDAQHIAIASVNNFDYIVSLNFHHINKLKTKGLIGAVNVLQGYKADIIICSPMEVTDYEVDE